MEKCTKSLGTTLKQAIACVVIQTTAGKVHCCGAWQVGKNKHTKNYFCSLPELGALSYFDLHIEKQKKEYIIHFLLDVSYTVVEPFPRKLVNVLSWCQLRCFLKKYAYPTESHVY